MSADAIRWYRSKVDWWLALVLCIPPIASVGVCIALVMDDKAAELPWGLVSVLFVLGIYFGLVFPMRYGLDDNFLHVRFGLCKQRIPLISVLQVFPTRNPLSSPALSLDRLHVQFGAGVFEAVMISPSDQDRFLDEFAQRAGLMREEDRLQRM